MELLRKLATKRCSGCQLLLVPLLGVLVGNATLKLLHNVRLSAIANYTEGPRFEVASTGQCSLEGVGRIDTSRSAKKAAEKCHDTGI